LVQVQHINSLFFVVIQEAIKFFDILGKL
jgi:hypothetical protein